jgi:nucleotide-binding universal stress UspA family protein
VSIAKILVGIDGEEGGRDALALARALGGDAGELTLAFVAPGEGRASRAANLAFDAAVRSDAEALLERERAAAGVDAVVRLCEAPSVGSGLQHLAGEAGAALVVVGTSRRSALARLLGGDDARGTIREATLPVAVAPRGYAAGPVPIRRIGVGFDESDEALAALELARVLAAAHGAAIDVVEAVEVATWLVDPAVAPALSKDTELRRQAAQERLAALPGVEAHATTGLSLQEMRALGTEVDVLLVGWRPHGWIERAMEGSTGEALSHDPRCPVIVVPATPPAPR